MGSVGRGQRVTWAGKLLGTAGQRCGVGCDPAGEGRGLGQLERGQFPSLIWDKVSGLPSGKALTAEEQTYVKEKGLGGAPLLHPFPS